MVKVYKRTKKCSTQHKHIVTELVESHIRQDNEALHRKMRAKQNENNALRSLLRTTEDRMSAMLQEIQRLNEGVQEQQQAIDLGDTVIQEYFINHARS